MPQNNQISRELKWHKSIVFKVVFIFVSIFVLVVVSLIIGQHYFKRKEVALRFGQNLKTITQNYAPLISGEDLKGINGQKDAESAEFKKAKAVLAKIKTLNQLDEDLVYILKPINDEEWSFTVMLQGQTFIGDVYKPPQILKEVYRKALSGHSAHSSIFHDEHGSFISGVAPIRDHTGKVVAILEADYRLQRYLDQLQRSINQDIWMTLGALLLLILVGVGMYLRIKSLINDLLNGTTAIENQDFEYRIAVNGQNELSILATALNKVIMRLKERGEMMKFLPTHTQHMIKRVLRGGEAKVLLSEARDLEVVVLESDIRGFTALSENLTPSETISLINRYIELQATFLLEYGGSIDKYMGDAVLVIFEGKDSASRALYCAKCIMEAVQMLNDQISESIQIGIGISSGHVVMGNMGCEARMEHTVIGPTVNLAARLCSAAKEGEIVAQKRIIEALSPEYHELSTLFEDIEEITVKGFSKPVSVYRAILNFDRPSPSSQT
jgi:class 3 adenylate cyclase